jgi:hypothetical protein
MPSRSLDQLPSRLVPIRRMRMRLTILREAQLLPESAEW